MTRFSSMQRFACLLTGAVLTAAAASPSTAWAADLGPGGEVIVDSGWVWEIGGGLQYVDLPNMRYTFFTNNNGQVEKKQNNGDLSEYGGAFSGTLYSPDFRIFGNVRSSLTFSGHYAEADNSKRTNCESTNDLFCTVQNIENVPFQVNSWTLPNFTTHANRDVEYWRGSAELTFGPGRAVMPREEGGFLFRYSHWGVGVDVRSLDQDNRLKLTYDVPQNMIRLNETLDSTYTGGYLSVTGEFNILGYLGIGSNWDIRSYATLRAGLYNVEKDYNGRFIMEDVLNGLNTHLRLSDDDVAFIGGASFETRMPICNRTSLSLLTDYEYFSDVARMRYAAGGDVTRIDDDDMLAVRTQIRFNVGLGSSELYD